MKHCSTTILKDTLNKINWCWISPFCWETYCGCFIYLMPNRPEVRCSILRFKLFGLWSSISCYLISLGLEGLKTTISKHKTSAVKSFQWHLFSNKHSVYVIAMYLNTYADTHSQKLLFAYMLRKKYFQARVRVLHFNNLKHQKSSLKALFSQSVHS